MSKAPTHHSDDDAPKKKRRGASVMAWLLVAMLIGGLGGFGVQSFGGGLTAIGRVGDAEITVNDYFNGMQQQISGLSQQFGMPITMEQARAFGLDRQVLDGLVNRAALNNEAARIGLSVGDAVVAQELAANTAFHGIAGSFDRDAYRLALQNSSYTEAIYEATLRADVARSILQGAVSGGLVAPAALSDAVFAYAGEKRGFTLLRVTEASLAAPVAEPTEAEISAWYEANIATYTRPEARRITYAALLPGELAGKVEIDEATLQAAYGGAQAEYLIPEKRLVERLVFGSDAEAAAAKARIDAGETFEAIVAERGLQLADIDMGDVAQADLGAAGADVFALTGPGVAGPLPSDLGPALYRMNAILAAQETTFEQAKAALLEELRLDAARKQIADRVEAIDDLLASGATLQDLATEEGMILATTDYVPGASDNAPIADQAAFRDEAGALAEGDFAEAIVLQNGGIVAMQLDEMVPPTPRPLEAVKAQVTQAARAAAVAKALSDHATTLKAQAEPAPLGSLGIAERTAAMGREATVEGAPASLTEAVFQMAPGDLRVVEGDGFTALLRLDQVIAADAASPDGTALRDAIEVNVTRALATDLFALYTQAVTAEAGISLDQAAIDAVNAQIPN